jgi:phosphoadenosine phosphosulfate reductase
MCDKANEDKFGEGAKVSAFITKFNERLQDAHPDDILRWCRLTFGEGAVLGTGFGTSGMVLIHRLHSLKLNIPVFYLDTNLLFEETYRLCDELKTRFDVNIIRVSPELSLNEQARRYGEELWNSDPDTCCRIRKVQPLRRFLSDKSAWISGVRRDQSDTRRRTQVIEWDPENRVVKINPLVNWTTEEVWSYIRIHELPYNPLHDEGYPSIGCIPCTHPVGEGEDERAGRWRGSAKTECGIHIPSQSCSS